MTEPGELVKTAFGAGSVPLGTSVTEVVSTENVAIKEGFAMDAGVVERKTLFEPFQTGGASSEAATGQQRLKA